MMKQSLILRNLHFSRNKKIKINHLIVISISVFFLFAFDIQAIQVGTPQIYWDPPIKISGPAVINNIDLVVDKQGVAHFFWDEGSQEDGGEDSVIYYRNYDGDQLSTPVDILITPETGQANTPSVCLDTNNMVHIVWIGNSGLWYSNTYMDQAADVHSWKTPIMLASPVAAAARASIICSPDGSLHLAYIVFRQFADIYYTQSIDGGNDWTIPTNVSLSGDTTIGPFRFRCVLIPIIKLISFGKMGNWQMAVGPVITSTIVAKLVITQHGRIRGKLM